MESDLDFDFDYLRQLLCIAYRIRRTKIWGNITGSDLTYGLMEDYLHIKDPAMVEFLKKMNQLVEAWNTQCPTSSIDSLFYQLSDGVIRYTKGQICILTHPESTEPIDPKTLI